MKNLKRNAGVSTLIATIALLVIIIAASLFIYTQYMQISEDPDISEGIFYGTVNVTVSEDNYLDRGATVSSTSDSYIAYHTKGKTLDEAVEDDFLGGATFTVGTSKGISVNPEDNGHFFLKTYTGTDFYLHIQGTIDANPRINTYKYVDVDNDNRYEVVFDVDVADLAAPDPNQSPSMDCVVMVIAEDGTTALNSPSDQDSIGTGTKTGTIEWQLSGIAEKTGEALARVYVTQNRTQEDYMTVTDIDIDQVGTYSGGDITYDSGAKAWYVDIGIDDYKELVQALDNALLQRPAGGKSTVDITISWETYFTAATDATNVTLYVETIDADEALNTALSDAVALGG